MNVPDAGTATTGADLKQLAAVARRIRSNVLAMVEGLGHGYVGQGLGTADLFAALYFGFLRLDPENLDWPDRDRFVLSTGHYAIALIATLTELGVFAPEELRQYGSDGSRIEQNATEVVPGFEITGGSLSQGLSQAVGMALGARLAGRKNRIVCMLSDGELQEGQIWEAAMAAGHYALDNLIGIVDNNELQADGPPARIMGVEPIPEKFIAFGWEARRIDGNELPAIIGALHWADALRDKPAMIVADTVPGKGVPSLERREKVHYVRPAGPDSEWSAIRHELEAQEMVR
ncbi:MAG: transketolase [Chloroflexota bacterium]|nr:MAG: transketolase [Chloroflexota bacterium]